MSDTPTHSNAGTIEGADESLAASVRAALVEWAEHSVPALGADFTDANWAGAKTEGLDLDSAQIDSSARGALSDAQNLDRARVK